MARDPKYDILFEPVQLGPKTTRNRFWQVPHCVGAGSDRPGMQAAFRGMKAEGGWGAIFTEVCSMSPDNDSMPFVAATLWDAGDVRNLAMMCDRVHEHGSLAGIEMAFSGGITQNAETRAPGRTISQIPNDYNYMANGRALGRDEIRALRREHVDGAKRARAAGFDLLTFYCGLAGAMVAFLYPFFNKRSDQYGGSFENRIRFTREVLEDVREAIDDCAIGLRFSIDTLDEPYGYGDLGLRYDGEGVRFIETVDPFVDYWDLNIGTFNWGEDAASSRFFQMNHEAQYTRIAKTVSSKPCINVGRFTDPDLMVEVIESGQCDIIGAARPSIADPFLPLKIEEGRLDDIRECIGCNICISRFEQGGPPIWCTQNATSGEEFRRGWHPEKFSRAANADNDVVVIGAGPAGMECAMVLGKRGMRRVHLVDSEAEMGGHLNWLTTLPGFATWSRVTAYRRTQLAKLKNVQFIPGTALGTDDVLDYGAELVVVATGSTWATNGMNGPTHLPLEGADATLPYVCTPEQVLVHGKPVGERVVVFDTDGFHIGPALAEALAVTGSQVTYVTPFDLIAPYLRFTLEEQRQYQRLRELGVAISSQTMVTSVNPDELGMVHIWSGTEASVGFDSLVLVTQRESRCEMYNELIDDRARLDAAGIRGVYLIGDAWQPGLVAAATFSGHRLAREIDSPDPSVPLPFIRERRLVRASDDDYTLASPVIKGDTLGVTASAAFD